ncbi:hypothetical protein HD554DRAFT_2329099, partial [Boletus coccyginus]
MDLTSRLHPTHPTHSTLSTHSTHSTHSTYSTHSTHPTDCNIVETPELGVGLGCRVSVPVPQKKCFVFSLQCIAQPHDTCVTILTRHCFPWPPGKSSWPSIGKYRLNSAPELGVQARKCITNGTSSAKRSCGNFEQKRSCGITACGVLVLPVGCELDHCLRRIVCDNRGMSAGPICHPLSRLLASKQSDGRRVGLKRRRSSLMFVAVQYITSVAIGGCKTEPPCAVLGAFSTCTFTVELDNFGVASFHPHALGCDPVCDHKSFLDGGHTPLPPSRPRP